MAMQTHLHIPPLEAGDRLSQPEFHRRYLATPSIKRAELLEGIVYVPSPLGIEFHGSPHGSASAWLNLYRSATPFIQFGDNSTVILDHENEVQPDALLRIRPTASGNSRISKHGYVLGPPELVFEVASSSASYDLHAKRRVYERAGVQEYWVWRTRDGAIDAWRLEAGHYTDIVPDKDGLIHSRVFPGLVLDPAAMLADDLARVIDVQMAQRGGPAHAAFLAEIAETQE